MKDKMSDAEFSAFLFSIPMRPWAEIEPGISKRSRQRYSGCDDDWLRACYGKGWRGLGRQKIINRLVKRSVQHCLESWSRDVSAGRKIAARVY